MLKHNTLQETGLCIDKMSGTNCNIILPAYFSFTDKDNNNELMK